MPISKYSTGLEGRRFGRWTIVRFSYSQPEGNKSRAFFWLARCDCGVERHVNVRLMFRGKSTSCGCYQRETNGQQGWKHGAQIKVNGVKKKQSEYNSWDRMIQRCDNPKWNHGWHRYGGRGITVCQGFRIAKNFLDAMGKKPSPKHSIDRANNDGHYSCGTCSQCLKNGWPFNLRWATPKEQAANTMRNPKYQQPVNP